MRHRCLIFVVAALAMPFGQAADPAETLAPIATAFIVFTQNLFKQGNKLLDILATSQAKDATSTLYSDARRLAEKKSSFRVRLRDPNMNASDLGPSIEEFRQLAWQLGRSMDKFGSEIDRASNLKTGPLLEQARALESSKLQELDEIRRAYESNAPDRVATAIQHLDAAIADMQRVEAAASCILDTIEKKQVVCDSELKRIAAKSAR